MKSPAYQSPQAMFQQFAAFWYAGSNIAPGVASRLGDSYSSLMKRLAEDPDLAFLDAELVNGPRVPAAAPPSADIERKAFFFVLEAIQLMENVWSDFGLESAANRNNPKNAGWMEEFRKWASSNTVVKTWKASRDNYNPLFQQFFENLHL
jgi:hypothetical protein